MNFNSKISSISITENASFLLAQKACKGLPTCITERDINKCRETLLLMCRRPFLPILSLQELSLPVNFQEGTPSDLVALIDKQSIARISFCPHASCRKLLYDQSLRASVALEAGERGPLLSKFHHLPPALGLCPESLNPDDTILARMGAGHEVKGVTWTPMLSSAIDPDINQGFTILPDRNMLFAGSNGPNAVLTECHDIFGPNRINLFGDDRESTLSLLKDFLLFRSVHLRPFLNVLVQHAQQSCFLDDFKIDPTKDATLPHHLKAAYTRTVSLFAKVLKTAKPLPDCGIGCVSFCQTWVRHGSRPGDANFSVMSPHFQTRFHITDGSALLTCGVTQSEIAGYNDMVKYHDSKMAGYSIESGGQSFIHVDDLYSELLERE